MRHRALCLLARWAQAAEEYWTDEDDLLGYYGTHYPHWGVQSNLNYAAAVATLASQEGAEESSLWRRRARSALRYTLATHLTGSRSCPNGARWGNTWISMLGIERALQGLRHILPDLSPADEESLRRVLLSEADWLLTPKRGATAGVCAGLWNAQGNNCPESNIWSGCFLWRVATLFPEEPHADRWRQQAHRFLVNGVSVPSDADDTTCVAGRPVCAWHIGANFFPNYGLDHHGYLNVGYMAVCVSNVALLHFDLKQAKAQPPDSLYRHIADLWGVLRRFIFKDGRLCRIGGDSRVRYAYCQEYLLPCLLFAADYLGDPHALELADRLLALMEKEAEGGNGLFYARRLDWLRQHNPHYYARLESDRAVVLAMLLNYLPLIAAPPCPQETFEESVAGHWCEEAHGAVCHRSARRLASFSWRAAHGSAQGLCLPPDDGSMAEWWLNLCPAVRCLGDDGTLRQRHRRLVGYTIGQFEGGFVTCGSLREGVDVVIEEGASCTDQVTTSIAFAALPDGCTCVCLQYVEVAADRVVYLAELEDLRLVIPNDLFNGCQRTLFHADGRTVLCSPPERNTRMEIANRWLNVDDRLGVVVLYGSDRLLIDRCATRRAGRFRSLYTEEVCLHARQGVWKCEPGEVLADVGFAVLSGATAAETSARSGGLFFSGEAFRGVWVEGKDGRRYAVVANFSSDTQVVSVGTSQIEVGGRAAAVRQIG